MSDRTNPEKVKRAAAHPHRPGEKCQAEAGIWKPVVDHNRCEGKNDCVEVCPYDVFEVRTIDTRDYDQLGFLSRLKVRVHGMKTAYTPRADLCQSCGLCIVACPEKALSLVKVASLMLLLSTSITQAAPLGTWPTPEERGLTEITGVLHLHSPYSHDACNYEPMDDAGNLAQWCLDDLREDICRGHHQFYFLTDHRSNMAGKPWEDLLLYDPTLGDILIPSDDGGILANEVTCDAGGVTWPVWLMAGLEGSHNMPVGQTSHLDNQDLYGVGFGVDTPLDSQLAEIDDIHNQEGLALLAHAEEDDVTVERILELGIDGLELYNSHSNINTILNDDPLQLLWLEPWMPGATNPPESDYVALVMYPYLDPRPEEKWDKVLASVPMPGVVGTDVHENVTLDAYCSMRPFLKLCEALERPFPNFVNYLREGGPVPLADGNRLDSYLRMFRWFSNHVRVSVEPEPQEIKDILREGLNYVSFDILGVPLGFDFVATADFHHFAEMGQEVEWAPGMTLHVQLPVLSPVDVRGEFWTEPELEPANIYAVLRKITATGSEEVERIPEERRALDFAVEEPGTYRVEVFISPRHLVRELGSQPQYALPTYLWIWSNPIYVR